MQVNRFIYNDDCNKIEMFETKNLNPIKLIYIYV